VPGAPFSFFEFKTLRTEPSIRTATVIKSKLYQIPISHFSQSFHLLLPKHVTKKNLVFMAIMFYTLSNIDKPLASSHTKLLDFIPLL
jgi:hypothetical protein